MQRLFENLNSVVVGSINTSSTEVLQPYKENLITKLPKKHIPIYFTNGDYSAQTSKKPSKPTWSDLVKIFEVNQCMRDVMFPVKERFIKPGQDVAQIDKYLYESICSKGMFPSCLGYQGYPKCSCISVNEKVAHGLPYKYKLKEGDVVKIDVCVYNGYHSDFADTYIVPGKGESRHKHLVETTRLCLDKALTVCYPGSYYKSIGSVVGKTANDRGFTVISRLTGHAIGKDLHMFPRVYNHPHSGLEDEGLVMKVGDMFTIEPILSEGGNDIEFSKDGFTIVTKDKHTTAHFERVILITEDGHSVLNDVKN